MSIIYAVRDSSRYIYHYTDSSKALDYILKDRTLLLNSFSSTNDPKESKCWRLTPFTTQNPAPEKLFDRDLAQQIAENLKRTVFLACFCSDSEGLSGDHTKDILLRGLARPRMWAQYAEKHQGFCLVFDKAKLLERIAQQFPDRLFLFGPVTYRDQSWSTRIDPNPFRIEFDHLQEIGVTEYSKKHMLHYARELYFEKLTDWRDEKEWRVVLMDHTGPPSLLKFEDSLVGVVHGAETRQEHSKHAVDLANDACITHTGLTWINHSPWYDLGNPLWLPR